MSGPKKCAHGPCSCIVPDGKRFCSQICEDSVNTTSIRCDCRHEGCD
jgi:hypothetical protein